MLLCAELLLSGRSKERRRTGAVSGSGTDINLCAMEITGGSLHAMGSCSLGHHHLRPALS